MDTQGSHIPARRKSEVTWDEEVIEEHNKLRGTRMKIDEPDTPFEHGDGVEAASDDEEDVPVQGELEVVQVGKNGIEAKVAAAAEQKSTPSQIASLSDQWASLEGKLEAAASEADAGTLKVGAVKVAQEEGVRQKKKDFKDKRAAHYNEFQRVKEMKARMAAGNDDDDDDGGE